MKLKITARAAADAHLPAGKDEEIFWDADGLGLRLRRRGDGDGTVKTWIVQWKKHGRTRKVTLGKTGVLGVEAARAAAKKSVRTRRLSAASNATRTGTPCALWSTTTSLPKSRDCGPPRLPRSRATCAARISRACIL